MDKDSELDLVVDPVDTCRVWKSTTRAARSSNQIKSRPLPPPRILTITSHCSHQMAGPSRSSPSTSSRRLPWFALLLVAAASIMISAFLYPLDDFDPAAIPADDYPFEASIDVPTRAGGIFAASERLGDGLLLSPEDFAYDGEEGFLYTSCSDGWIRRVDLRRRPAEVEDWVYVGGRPLGLALGRDRNLVVAESEKGLMVVKSDKTTALLIDEAEGLKFRLIDGVDVASNGIIFFTDASYKYGLRDYNLDFLEGRPHGRLLSFDPSTNKTDVLVQDLYFANGVSLSPDERSLIFCETLVRRCKRYHIHGEKAGTVETFIENLPGLPDNIRYDGEGHYWIALPGQRTLAWDMLMKYPFLRKLAAIYEKLVGIPHLKNSGVLKVNLEGQPLALYSDPELRLVTGGIRIGEHLYYGSLINPYIGRINLTYHALYAI